MSTNIKGPDMAAGTWERTARFEAQQLGLTLVPCSKRAGAGGDAIRVVASSGETIYDADSWERIHAFVIGWKRGLRLGQIKFDRFMEDLREDDRNDARIIDAQVAALRVITETVRIRDWLQANDPNALAQCLDALGERS